MSRAGPGVGEEMASSSSRFPARLLALGIAVVLLADVPGAFTRGDVLRGVLFPFLAAAAAALGVLLPARRTESVLLFGLLLLPLAIPISGLFSATGGDLAPVLRASAVWLGLAALALGLTRTWHDESDVLFAWRALVGAGAIAAAWTLFDALARQAPGAGPFGRPGIAGPVLAALLAAAVFLPQRGRRALRTVLVLLLAAGCAATLSRTGLLAALLGVLGAGALTTGEGTRQRWRLAFGAVAVVAAVAVALAGTGHLRIPGGGTTLEVRFGLYRAAGRLVAERPVTGHGMGSFPVEILRVRDAEEAGLSRGRRPVVAHDDYLHVAAEGGLPAALAFLVYVGGVLGVGIAATRRARDGPSKRLAGAATGAFLALAVAALGEDVFLDPAGVLVAGLAAASVVACSPGAGRGIARGLPFLFVPLALLSLGAAGIKTRDLMADVHVDRYRDILGSRADPLTASFAVQDHLIEGALPWREDHAEAWYRLGVHRAKLGSFAEARRAWTKALEADPGMTEARLDIAKSFEMQGRTDDARAALEEAARHDPTRYELHMRLGHLALGPEPVAGERSDEAFDAVRAHRHYNEAERCGPDRFETWVARARIARRRGDLPQAGELLRRAQALSPNMPETVLESFRLAEVERTASDLVAVGVLGLALVSNPDLAFTIATEAERFLDEGREREAAARRAVAGTLQAPDYAAADRAYDAAARRIAGLLHARMLSPARVITAATADESAAAWRSTLARLRALLSWASLEPVETPMARKVHLENLADLFQWAAKVASRTDATLARHFYARAHAAQGALLIEEEDWKAARDVLEGAVEEAPENAEIRLGLARALVQTGDLERAEKAVLEALRIAPDLADAVRREPDFEPLQRRPAIRRALGAHGDRAVDDPLPDR